MLGINYKISLDTPGFNSGLKSVNAVHSATGAFTSLLRGDFVSAAVQARTAWMALRVALLANPMIAIAASVTAVAGAFAAWAIKRHTDEINGLAEATKNYRERLAELRGEKMTPLERASATATTLRGRGDSSTLTNLSVQAEMSASEKEVAADRAQAEARRISATGLFGGRFSTSVAKYENDAARLRTEAEELRQAAMIYRQARAEITMATTEDVAKTAEAMSEFMDQRRATRLAERMAGQSEPQRLRIRLEDARERLGQAVEAERGAPAGTTDTARFKMAKETERIRGEIALLTDALHQMTTAAADGIRQVRRQEAEYAYSMLSPDQQLTGINTRAREIMGQKGWEQNVAARQEMLRLRQMRGEIMDRSKAATAAQAATAAGSTTASEVSADALFDNARRGSAADSVLRMRGSLEGGFADRLRQSAFARTRAELDERRASMANAAARSVTVHTGEEKPVEVTGQALDYLRRMADGLTKDFVS